MSFLRHGESIDPMTLVPLGVSGLAHSQCSSASMSSSRLFLGRLLSSRACLRFADRERFSKTKPRRTMIFQRTATPPLTSCLSPRVHSSKPHPYSGPADEQRPRLAEDCRLKTSDQSSSIPTIRSKSSSVDYSSVIFPLPLRIRWVPHPNVASFAALGWDSTKPSVFRFSQAFAAAP